MITCKYFYFLGAKEVLRNHFGNFYVSDHTDKRTIGWLWMCLKTHFPFF